MRRPQIVVYERDGRLAGQLQSLADERRWVLRESRRPDACLKMLTKVGPSVLVVRVPRGAEEELRLLRDSSALPGVRTVAVGEAEEAPGLAGLAWDLGADFALFPPTPQSMLNDIAAGLMGHA